MKKFLWLLFIVILLGAGYYAFVRSWNDDTLQEIPDSYFAVSGYNQNLPLEKNGLIPFQQLLTTNLEMLGTIDSALMRGSGEALYGVSVTGSSEKVVYVGETFNENRARYSTKVSAIYSGAETQIKAIAAQTYTLLQQYPIRQDTVKVGTGIDSLVLQAQGVQPLVRVLNAAAMYNCSIQNYDDCAIFFSVAYGISYKVLNAKSNTLGMGIGLVMADHTLASIQSSIYNFDFTGDSQDMLKTIINLPLDTDQILTDSLKTEYIVIRDILNTAHTQAALSGLSQLPSYDHEETQQMLKNYYKRMIERTLTKEEAIEAATYGTYARNLSSPQKYIAKGLQSSEDKLFIRMVKNGGGLKIIPTLIPRFDQRAPRLNTLAARRATIIKLFNEQQ